MNRAKEIELLKQRLATTKKHDGYSHTWSDTDGSRCEKCGDKDWMASPKCPVSDQQHEASK